MEPETPESGLDRRKLIKRAGIVTAGVAAWSTPMVTSLASAAHAAGSAPSDCGSCDLNDPCFGQTLCNPTGGQFGCYCSQRFDRSGCTCLQAGFCNDFLVCPGGQSDCPAGYTCVFSCCAEARCLPQCDNTTGARVNRDPNREGRKSAPF